MSHTTDIPTRTADKHPGAICLDRFECVLPPDVRAELLRECPAKPIESPSPAILKNKVPRRLKSLLTFAGIVMTPISVVAILVGIIAAFGGLKSGPSPEMQRITLTALDKVRSGQHAVPPSSAVAAYSPTERSHAITQPMPAVEARKAAPAVMRGELVSLPVRRASLVKLPN